MRLLVAGLLVLGAALVPAPAQAVTVELDPLHLDRGAPSAVPHIEGTTLVDGAVRVPVGGRDVTLVGKTGDSYVVDVVRPHRRGAVLLVAADGSTTTLASHGTYESVLSDDGQTVVTSLSRTYRRTTFTALSLTGATLATTVVRGIAFPLAARGTETLVGVLDTPGTLRWEQTTGAVTEVSPRQGTRADYASDLLVGFTKDTLDGGCTVVSRLSDPSAVLWRSCEEAVISLSTDGSHLVTSFILGGGESAESRVTLRTVDGTPIASYRPAGGFIATAYFESGSTLLLEPAIRDAAGKNAATVRCVAARCERASRTYRINGLFS